MNKTQKFIRKLPDKDQLEIAKTMRKLTSRDWYGLDVIRLKGQTNIFRCRIGRVRIIFSFTKNVFELISVDNRSESTYRNF